MSDVIKGVAVVLQKESSLLLTLRKAGDKLIQFIAEHFKFDAATYPDLHGKGSDEVLAFATRHLALHFIKTAGKIAAVSEDGDHGNTLNIEELKANVPKALINTLRLAELLHMSESDIIADIEEKYSDRIE